MLATNKYLKTLDKETLKKLFKISDLTDTEYWIMRYAYIEKRMVENTCMKLSISRAYYFILKNQALIKVYYTLKQIKKI